MDVVHDRKIQSKIMFHRYNIVPLKRVQFSILLNMHIILNIVSPTNIVVGPRQLPTVEMKNGALNQYVC